MKEILITKMQFEEIVFASEDNNPENSYYFDMITGDVELMNDYVEIDEDLSIRIEDEFGDRYIRVPRIESHEAYEDMVDFANTISDLRIKNKILNSLDGKRGVFRRFKDKLTSFPNELERWYQYKEEKNKKRVLLKFEKDEEIKLIVE